MRIGNITKTLFLVVHFLQVVSWCNNSDNFLNAGWKKYNGALYKMLENKSDSFDCDSWESYCQTNGGSLSTAKTAEENNFVKSIQTPGRGVRCIGLRYFGINWIWNDGTPAIYTDWRTDAKFQTGYCAFSYVNESWYSYYCSSKYAGAICKCAIAVGCNATNPCSNPYADCTSGICQCRSGYTLSGTLCQAGIDLPCDTTNGCFNHYASCTAGICQCNTGYTKTGTNCSADVGTPCNTFYGCSSPYASCNGTCQCKTGYTTNGTLCKADFGSKCDANNGCSNPYAYCTNATCQCMSGYIQNGTLCKADFGSKCDANNGCSNPYAYCTNATCQCMTGYIQNGTLCKAELGYNCSSQCADPNAQCSEMICKCQVGYYDENGDEPGGTCGKLHIVQMKVSLYLVDVKFTEELQNFSSPQYTNTSTNIMLKIRNRLSTLNWYINSSVLRFYNESNEITLVELNIQIWATPTENIDDIMCTLKKLCNLTNQDDSWKLYLYNIDGVLVEPGQSVFRNGTNVFLTCTCMGKGLEWYYDDSNNESMITTTSNSRIQRQDQAINSTTTSNLIFQPVLESDIGWYECRCKINISYVKVAGIRMDVHVPAQVEVSPFTQTVYNGSNASINCKLNNKAENVSFLWFKDGTPLQNNSGNLEYLLNGSISRLEITNIAQSANYLCMGHNSAGSGNNATATVYVLNGKDQYCVNQTDDIWNTTWENTNSGTVNRKPCPSGFKGEATRNCLSNGSWEDPVYGQCVNEKLLYLEAQIDKLKDGFRVTNVSTVLEDLQNATNPNAGVLKEAELKVVVSMLSKLVNIKNSTGANVSDYTDFLTIASNTIDAGTANSWTKLITKEKQGAETVMKTVEDFVFSDLNVSRLSNSSQTIHKNNLDVEIGYTSLIEFQLKRSGPSLNNKPFTTSLRLHTDDMSLYAAVIFVNVSGFLQKTVSDGNILITTDRLDIGPDVMSLQLNPRPANLTRPLQLKFEAFNTQYHAPLCSYWELNATGTGEGAWSSKDCSLVTRNSSGFLCECNHLTNFAILMTTYEIPETQRMAHSVYLSIISAVGCAVSIIFLLLTIFRHLQVWKYVKSRKTCIVLNICVALIFSYGIFLAGVNRTENKDVCKIVAALLHYFYLTVFFLMLVEGIEIAVSVMFVFFNKSRLKFLLPLAWLIPAGIVGASLGISHLNGYGNDQNCWLTVRHGLIWAFVGPAALIIVCNAVIIFVVMKKMFNTSVFMSKTQKDKAKTSLRSLGVLLPITGVTWILGVFSVNEDLYIFQYLFTIFNSLQGLFIFVFHCLLNSQIRAALQEKRRRKKSLETSSTDSKTAPNDKSRKCSKDTETNGATNGLDTSSLNSNTGCDESNKAKETANHIKRNSRFQAIVLQLQDFVTSKKNKTIHRSQPSDTETDCRNETHEEYYN